VAVLGEDEADIVGLEQATKARLRIQEMPLDRPRIFVILDRSPQQRVQVDHGKRSLKDAKPKVEESGLQRARPARAADRLI